MNKGVIIVFYSHLHTPPFDSQDSRSYSLNEALFSCNPQTRSRSNSRIVHLSVPLRQSDERQTGGELKEKLTSRGTPQACS